MTISEEQPFRSKSFYLPGEVVNGLYEIESLLGRGTSGTVYKARDIQVGTTVALKLISSSVKYRSASSKRLHSEIRIAYRVKSDYVTNLYSCFTDDSHVGLVLEYVNGTSLYDLNQALTVFSFREIINIGRQVALGLQAIHDAGIIHRDLKLENILLDENGIAKITDFGVSILETAFLEDDDEGEEGEANPAPVEKKAKRATEEGKVVGTVHYLSPEYLKTRTCDTRADVYALGIVLYELVTTKYPFEYKTIKHLVQRKIKEDPTPPIELREDCPKWLNDLIMKAMSRDPDKRYQSAKEVYDEFAHQLHHSPVISSPIGSSEQEHIENKVLASARTKATNDKVTKYSMWALGSTLFVLVLYLVIMQFEYTEMLYYQWLHSAGWR